MRTALLVAERVEVRTSATVGRGTEDRAVSLLEVGEDFIKMGRSDLNIED